MNKYYELKSREKWLGYLISQKEEDGSEKELKKELDEVKGRIGKMEVNLVESIDQLARNKTLFL